MTKCCGRTGEKNEPVLCVDWVFIAAWVFDEWCSLLQAPSSKEDNNNDKACWQKKKLDQETPPTAKKLFTTDQLFAQKFFTLFPLLLFIHPQTNIPRGRHHIDKQASKQTNRIYMTAHCDTTLHYSSATTTPATTSTAPPPLELEDIFTAAATATTTTTKSMQRGKVAAVDNDSEVADNEEATSNTSNTSNKKRKKKRRDHVSRHGGTAGTIGSIGGGGGVKYDRDMQGKINNYRVIVSYLLCVLYTEFWLAILHMISPSSSLSSSSSSSHGGDDDQNMTSAVGVEKRSLPLSSMIATDRFNPVIYICEPMFIVHVVLMAVVLYVKRVYMCPESHLREILFVRQCWSTVYGVFSPIVHKLHSCCSKLSLLLAVAAANKTLKQENEEENVQAQSMEAIEAIDEDERSRVAKLSSWLHFLIVRSNIVYTLVCLSNVTIRYVRYDDTIPFPYLVTTPFLSFMALSTTDFWNFLYEFAIILTYLLSLMFGLYSLPLKLLNNELLPFILQQFSNIDLRLASFRFIELSPLYCFFLWKSYHQYCNARIMEEAKKESIRQKNLLETVIGNMPSILWSVDRDMNMQFLGGKSLAAICPDVLKVRSFIGRHVSEVIDLLAKNHDMASIMQHYQSALEGNTITYTIFSKYANFTLRVTLSPLRDDRNKIIGVIGQSLDITELVEAENALKTSEEYYRSLVTDSEDLIMKLDRDGTILFTNSRNIELFDEDPAQHLGQHILALFKNQEEDVRLRIESKFIKAIKQKKSSHCEWSIDSEHEEAEKTSDSSLNLNSKQYFVARFSPITKDDSILAIALVISNVTEKMKAQESILEAERAIVASESKSAFLRVLSHELRNPLNSVLGGLQLLSATENLSLLQQEYIDDTNESAKLLLDIIQDVLDMSKIEEGKLVLSYDRLNIMSTIETTADMYYLNATDKNLEIVTFVDPNIPEVVGDKTRLGQVLSNLCTNSIKFTHVGFVYLYAHLESETEDHVTVTIGCEDTGSGIPMEEMHKVFKPFSQLSNATNESEVKGWGLGLAITNQLVQLMDGHISLISPANEHGGCNFKFTVKFPKRVPNLDTSNEGALSSTQTEQKEVPSVSPLESKSPVEPKQIYPSRFENVILMVSCDVLKKTLSQYLHILRVAQFQFVNNATELSNAVNQCFTETQDVTCSTCIIIEKSFESLLPKVVLEKVTSKGNTMLKLISLYAPNPTEFRSNISSHSNSYHNLTSMNILMRKPIKFSRLMTALSERSSLPRSNSFNKLIANGRKNDEDVPASPLTNSQQSVEDGKDKLRILVVEDNALNRKIVTRLLKTCDIQHIVEVENGKLAVERVRETEEPFSVILMDLQMPVMDGKEATTIIRAMEEQDKSKTPIIALTANAWTNEREHCLEIGMNDVLTKPIQLDQLISSIRKATSNQ